MTMPPVTNKHSFERQTLMFDDTPPGSPVQSPVQPTRHMSVLIRKKPDFNTAAVEQTAAAAMSSIPNVKTDGFSIHKKSKANKENVPPKKMHDVQTKTPTTTRTISVLTPQKSDPANAPCPGTPPAKQEATSCISAMDYKRMEERKRAIVRSLPVDSDEEIEELTETPKETVVDIARKAMALNYSDTLVLGGVAYKKVQCIGKGHHCAVFTTNVPGVVVKHLHEQGVALLWGGVKEYWAGIQENTKLGEQENLPVAKINNLETMVDDVAVAQPQYESISLENLGQDPQLLAATATAVKKLYHWDKSLEWKLENLGKVPQTKTVVLVDVDNAKVDDDKKFGEESNTKQNLATFGKFAEAIDPRK